MLESFISGTCRRKVEDCNRYGTGGFELMVYASTLLCYLTNDVREAHLGGKHTWDAINTFLPQLKPLGKQNLVL